MANWRKRDGFVIGLIIGFFSIIFMGIDENFPFRNLIISGTLATTAILFVSSIGIGIISNFKRGSVISPPFDGFIYGFTLSFGISILIINVRNGTLPLPF